MPDAANYLSCFLLRDTPLAAPLGLGGNTARTIYAKTAVYQSAETQFLSLSLSLSLPLFCASLASFAFCFSCFFM